jgi:hypothetical protein
MPLNDGGLQESIERQEDLVDEVRKLRSSQRTLRFILAGMLVVLALVGVATYTARQASQRADDVTEEILLDRREEETTRMRDCLIANSRARIIRETVHEGDLAVIDSIITNLLAQFEDASEAAREGFRRGFEEAKGDLPEFSPQLDLDCNNDGEIDDGDYVAGT